MSRSFSSNFASDIIQMVEYKEALGYKPSSYEWDLQNFDRFCLKNYPKATVLTREIVLAWCQEGEEDRNRRSGYRAIAIRKFGKYLTAIGKDAFVLPTNWFPAPKADLPYLLTDEELSNFFSATDNYPSRANSPLLEYIVPVIFRLQYACGMRPQEVRLLKRVDFDFKRNTIYIESSKWSRDRRLSVYPKLMALCRKYDAIAQSYFPDRIYFFPSSQRDGAYSYYWLTATFHKCWKLSGNNNSSKSCVPYSLRHNYATRTLLRWVEEGKDFNVYLPYLSHYMGHASFKSTYYYVHLLPEKLGCMDFMNRQGVIPEVSDEA